MLRIWLMIALFITAALSGCADAPEDEGDDEDTGTGFEPGPDNDGNETQNQTTQELTVTWTETPEESGSGGFQVAWSVEIAGEGNDTSDDNVTIGNVTGGSSADIEETGVAYGAASVVAPSSPDDYDNTTGQTNDTTAPNDFEATVNTTADATLYLRAYAYADGTYYWSDEVQVNVTGAGGVEHEIVIQDGTLPVSQFAGFDTTELTIQVGDSVVWNNTAAESHNIVISGPEEFETGSIESGSASDPIVFQTEGAYTFEFESGSSESGTITVEG